MQLISPAHYDGELWEEGGLIRDSIKSVSLCRLPTFPKQGLATHSLIRLEHRLDGSVPNASDHVKAVIKTVDGVGDLGNTSVQPEMKEG